MQQRPRLWNFVKLLRGLGGGGANCYLSPSSSSSKLNTWLGANSQIWKRTFFNFFSFSRVLQIKRTRRHRHLFPAKSFFSPSLLSCCPLPALIALFPQMSRRQIDVTEKEKEEKKFFSFQKSLFFGWSAQLRHKFALSFLHRMPIIFSTCM